MIYLLVHNFFPQASLTVSVKSYLDIFRNCLSKFQPGYSHTNKYLLSGCFFLLTAAAETLIIHRIAIRTYKQSISSSSSGSRLL